MVSAPKRLVPHGSAISETVQPLWPAIAYLKMAEGVEVRAQLSRAGHNLRDPVHIVVADPCGGHTLAHRGGVVGVTSVWRKWRPGNTGTCSSSTRPRS